VLANRAPIAGLDLSREEAEMTDSALSTVSTPKVGVALSRPSLSERESTFLLVAQISQRRTRFVWSLFGAAFTIYLATLIAFSYWPNVVAHKVVGEINVAYLAALAQFVVTFGVARIYAVWARRVIDPLADNARATLEALSLEGSPPAKQIAAGRDLFHNVRAVQ
jgi:uncharacterized membrane protein (DUF485 family)